MIRFPAVAIMFAVTVALLVPLNANAQSPDPALLAPGQSGRMLAPPRYPASRSSYASAGHRDVFRSQRGARLSHPSTHLH
jgi:hypothetical protein